MRIGTQPYRQDLEVVGIADDARLYDVKDALSYAAFVPAFQYGELTSGGFLIVRGNGLDETVLQKTVESAGPDYIARIERLSDTLAFSLVQDGITARLAGYFGAVTLLLAAIGIGGLVAYTVAQRTREIAIRMALGAERARMAKSILIQGAAVTVAGTAIGLAVGIVSTRPIRGLLFGVEAYDPVVVLGVPVLLLTVALLACAIPACKAARIDPAIGLRTE